MHSWNFMHTPMLPLQASGSLRITTTSRAECKASGYMFGNVRKSARNHRNIFGNSRDEERKISCVWLSKRLKKLTLYQDAFHMHICLHIATRHNSLQGLNILIKEHFAKNAHQTKRVNRNRKLMCTDRIKRFRLINVPFLNRELRACARASYRYDVGNGIRSLARLVDSCKLF